eukprot:6571275-Alexandrium_andersonii.AAC.1
MIREVPVPGGLQVMPGAEPGRHGDPVEPRQGLPGGRAARGAAMACNDQSTIGGPRFDRSGKVGFLLGARLTDVDVEVARNDPLALPGRQLSQ